MFKAFLFGKGPIILKETFFKTRFLSPIRGWYFLEQFLKQCQSDIPLTHFFIFILFLDVLSEIALKIPANIDWFL